MWFGKRLDISSGINARGNSGESPSWHGWCYGSWLPQFRWNKGRLRKGEVLAVVWTWLVFHGSVTIWPRLPRKT
jgi:hypothetical protein